MSGSRESKEHRRFKRNMLQRVVVIIDNQPYLAKDWSPDGFAIVCDDPNMDPGTDIKGKIDIFEVEDPGEFRARVIRRNKDDLVACQFIELSAHIFMNLCMTVDMNEHGDYSSPNEEDT